MLSIVSYICWPFVSSSENVYSSSLPIFSIVLLTVYNKRDRPHPEVYILLQYRENNIGHPVTFDIQIDKKCFSINMPHRVSGIYL